MTYVKGLDVSYYEPKVNWERVLAQGYLFMFAKATQGIGIVDSRFTNHWAGAKQSGVLRGAYHYLVVTQDATKQADLFLSTLGNDYGELPAVLDLEGKYNETATNKLILAVAEIWLNRVEKATGRKPIIYSAYFFLRDRVSVPVLGTAPGWAKNYPLWIAQYLNHPATEIDTPLQPKGWQDWKFWQHSEKGMVDGITNDDGIPTAVDLNYFRGTVDDLYAFAGVTKPSSVPTPATPPAPPPSPVVGPVTPPAAPPEPVSPVSTGPITYIIAPGDNLYTIANRYHTTLEAIVHLNNITNPDLIYPGQVLVIPQ
jgi:lysozyme